MGIVPLVLAAYMSQVLRNNYTAVAEVAPSFPLVALADLAHLAFSYLMQWPIPTVCQDNRIFLHKSQKQSSRSGQIYSGNYKEMSFIDLSAPQFQSPIIDASSSPSPSPKGTDIHTGRLYTVQLLQPLEVKPYPPWPAVYSQDKPSR